MGSSSQKCSYCFKNPCQCDTRQEEPSRHDVPKYQVTPLSEHAPDCPCKVCHEARVVIKVAQMKGTPKLPRWPSEEQVETDAAHKIAMMKKAHAERDPWKHRSQGMVCATCMWSVIKYADGQAVLTNRLGRCRRRAPTMNGYPAVFENDWCGDHKLDENKINPNQLSVSAERKL